MSLDRPITEMLTACFTTGAVLDLIADVPSDAVIGEETMRGWDRRHDVDAAFGVTCCWVASLQFPIRVDYVCVGSRARSVGSSRCCPRYNATCLFGSDRGSSCGSCSQRSTGCRTRPFRRAAGLGGYQI
jgi:hypothetical protein